MYKKVLPYILLAIFFTACYYSLNRIFWINGITSITAFFHHFFTYLIGSLFVMTGVFCYIQKPNSIVVIHFFYLMYVTGVAVAFSKPSSLELSPEREIEMFSVSIAPYLLIRFFEYFPATAKPPFFHKIKSISFGLAMGINTIFVLLITVQPQYHPVFTYIYRLGTIINISVAIILCVGLIIMHLRSNSLWIKNQLYILIGSLVISFAPVLLFSLIPGGIFHLSSIPFHYSLNSIIVFPITLAYLLMKQEIIDFNTSIKKHIYKLIAISFTLIIVNLFFSFFINLSFQQSILLNLCIIASLLTYDAFHKLLEPYKIKKWKDKAEKIQREKKFIFQHLLVEGKHLTTCAAHIIGLIHKVIDIDGGCIIWKKEKPVILHQTGIFKNQKKCDQLLNGIINRNIDTTKILKEGPYYIFPLHNEGKTRGWIITGQKKNLTVISKDELNLLKKIQEDATELLFNAHSLYQIEKEIRKSQQTSDMFDHFNTAILNALEEEQKKLSIFLHDEVLQSLILVKNKCQFITKVDQDIEASMMNIIYEVREMCNDLHPIMVEDLGLEPSLQALKRKLQMNHNVLINVDCHLPLKIIPTSLSVHIFRMIKELIYNSIKHASPSTIDVSITEVDGVLTIKVEDNGSGFNITNYKTSSHQNSIGLATIQKRVNLLQGIFDIRSECDIGTSITIKLPIERSETFENQGVISR